MTIEQIEAAIPHRPPMRLLDAIIEQSESKIVCRKTFHLDEFFVRGHFPNLPIVPGVIQCECCLQAGAVLLAQQSSGVTGVPVVTRMDGVKFKLMVRPGDTVDIEAILNDKVGGAFFLIGRVLLDGKVATRLEFACTFTEPQA